MQTSRNSLIQSFQLGNHEHLNLFLSFQFKLFEFNPQQCLNHFHIIKLFLHFQTQFILKLDLLNGYQNFIEQLLYLFFALFSLIFYQSFSWLLFIHSQIFFCQLFSQVQQLFIPIFPVQFLIQQQLQSLQIMRHS